MSRMMALDIVMYYCGSYYAAACGNCLHHTYLAVLNDPNRVSRFERLARTWRD